MLGAVAVNGHICKLALSFVTHIVTFRAFIQSDLQRVYLLKQTVIYHCGT